MPIIKYPYIIGTFLFVIAFGFNAQSQSKKAYLKAAETAIRNFDIPSASVYYSKALDFDKNNAELNFKLANCLRQLNNYFLATQHYESVVNSSEMTQFITAVFYLGEMKKYAGEYEEAKILFETYIKLDTDSSTFFYRKAKSEIESCAWAMEQKYPNGLKVKPLAGKINTPATEFAPYLINDSIIYYSSLSFEGEKIPDNSPSTKISKILRSMDGSRGWRRGTPLKQTFNRTNSHNCNATLSADGKLMLFTRCKYNSVNELECKIYESALVNGRWQSPKRVNAKINKQGYTSTQPSIANAGAEGYIVYFVSNRPKGLGKLDIWQSKRSALGAYSEPVNLGSVINSLDDDITPFYHNVSHTLYFSSKAHKGFGGFDIFKSEATNFTYYEVENVGPLINSPFNDQYAVANSDASKVIFSSNRPEENALRNETCCYDLFVFNYNDTIEEAEIDTTEIALPDSLAHKEDFETLTQFAPIKLFFHNDEPDNDSWNTETEKAYLETHFAYTGLQSEYEKNYSLNNVTYSKKEAKERISQFFESEVAEGFERLEKFSVRLLEELQNGVKMKVMVRGYTSPLAATDYNLNLSKRRISSLKNHLNQYKDGVFLTYINSKQLVIEEEPAGERFVLPGVSDELEDVTNSVYSPEAARERRIEITRVIIIGE